MFDRGFTHFLVCLHTPDRIGRGYPTRDAHTEEQEQDFIAGFHHARRQHEASANMADYGDGVIVLEGY